MLDLNEASLIEQKHIKDTKYVNRSGIVKSEPCEVFFKII